MQSKGIRNFKPFFLNKPHCIFQSEGGQIRLMHVSARVARDISKAITQQPRDLGAYFSRHRCVAQASPSAPVKTVRLHYAASNNSSLRAGAIGGGCAASPRCVSIFSITSGCSMLATTSAYRHIHSVPCRCRTRALTSAPSSCARGALCSAHASCSQVCAVVCLCVPGTTFDRSFAFGASTP